MRHLAVIFFLIAIIAPIVLHAQSENYYAPWHCRIKDSTRIRITVSKVGAYISFGFGGANDKKVNAALTAPSLFMSCALAYKSHSFSWTLVGFGNDSDHPSYIQGGYYGFLYGESIRAQNLFLSLSTGVAYSSMTLKYPSQNSLNGLDMTRFDRQGYSFPIELKLFLLARNGIGLGIHLSKNIISPLNFSPFCWGVSIVFGVWNKPRVK